jgi:glutathione S-transferase
MNSFYELAGENDQIRFSHTVGKLARPWLTKTCAMTPYVRATREKRFGLSLERLISDRPGKMDAPRKVLSPLRRVLETQEFVAGEAPAYADYCVFWNVHADPML